MKKLNKKAVAPIVIIMIALAIIVVLYLLIWILPAQFFPSIAQFRSQINYYLVIALWVIVQIGVVYLAYKAISFVSKGLKDYRNMLTQWTQKIKRFILLH
jgi:hypothetical protein